MSSNTMKKKCAQLGMPIATATQRLRKMLIFKLLKKLNELTCHRCGSQIEHIDDLSADHIKPWLDTTDPKGLFFDTDNVAFSHLSCNSGATRQKKYFTDEERKAGHRKTARESKRRNYDAEKRHDYYEQTGY